MAIRVLSWQTVVVGDPLYRPFAAMNDISLSTLEEKGKSPWRAYREAAANFEGRSAERIARIRKTGHKLESGMIFEAAGLIQKERDVEAARESFRQARQYYSNPQERIRTVLHEIDILIGQGKKDAALRLTRRAIGRHGEAPAAAVLRRIEGRLAPPPSPSPGLSPAAAGTRTGGNAP
jgi:hypothetical protein